MKTTFYLISLASLLLFPRWSDAQGIASLTLIPSSPTTEDTVKLITNIWFPSGDCWLETNSVSVNAGNIAVVGCFNSGMLTVICNSTDTFTLGRLDAGNYTVTFTGIYPCPLMTWSDIQTLNLSVSGTTGIPYQTQHTDLQIVPNPGSGTFNICLPPELLNTDLVLKIFTLNGQQLTEEVTRTNHPILSFSPDLKPGFYLVTAESQNGKKYRARLLYQ